MARAHRRVDASRRLREPQGSDASDWTRIMLTRHPEFLRQAPGRSRPTNRRDSAERRVRMATAVLLVEVARSDHQFSESERQTVLASVQGKFGLSAEAAEELVTLAEQQSREAHDIFQFTIEESTRSFTPEQKVRLLEELWRAAYADSVLHEHEEYLIRRVADMLHLSHSQFITAQTAGHREELMARALSLRRPRSRARTPWCPHPRRACRRDIASRARAVTQARRDSAGSPADR